LIIKSNFTFIIPAYNKGCYCRVRALRAEKTYVCAMPNQQKPGSRYPIRITIFFILGVFKSEDGVFVVIADSRIQNGSVVNLRKH